MSSGFAFNFLAAVDDDDDDDLGEPANNPTFNDTGRSGSKNANAQGRFAFEWVDHLGPLLLDRAQEELVYTDVLLGSARSSPPAVLTGCGDGHNDCDDNVVDAEAQQQQQQQQQQPLYNTIRCVDLSSSSFNVPKQNASQAEGSNVDNEKLDHASIDDDEDQIWETTDIQTGIYEGGRKVWECSRDLIEYMVQEEIGLKHGDRMPADNHDENEPFFCLELGCGHGLPGCYLLREALALRNQDHDGGTSDFSLVLTDYNRSVVMDATVSNLVLNCLSSHIQEFSSEKRQLCNGDGAGADPTRMVSKAVDTLLQHVRVGAGDWMDMSQKILLPRNSPERKEQSYDPLLPSDGRFDLILAAETIYSESAARETALLLQRHLRPVTGVAYVATKRYYFGVGGGVEPFRKFVSELNDHDVKTVIETVRVIDNGTSNIREVLKVQCR